ncbi:ribosome-associated translation inhibitor RaiA [Propionimicrobium sp. PCR01-08-3]|uniref:ribosome hibernation-promoting factor, HPF/YfiA family n=1 Tax=Propionimicrobium sp. PCR01-08-3 TaxID=3052086 RepID=UPI00255C2B80|nr:ribosome-associated translation inhibitor RaiA [Propionimicrobium sp. PCR01-08-3]WIY83749.1 ribosome-associated translation inhibitor RaiA [Propionimicrobium sp. PCR01-08-3]
MDVSITGRHLTISDDTREQVSDELTATVEKLRDRMIRAEVEFTQAETKGDPDGEIRCEITLRGKGPVIRAGANASDKMIAFDRAEEKLKAQLRKAADRRKRRRGLRGAKEFVGAEPSATAVEENMDEEVATRKVAGDVEMTGDGPLVVREKRFDTVPLTLAQALDEMELVGHDFFLYVDAETSEPSVVYRRKAYDYGVIHLAVSQ